MKSITLNAPAKINLMLDIVGTLPNGYHDMKMIMQTIDLYDTITVIEMKRSGISITCDNPAVPCDSRNIVYKSAKAFFDAVGIKDYGVNIDIKKRIPSQAGMGGGSADGAAVFIALNKMFDTGMSITQMCETSKGIGADIPFCLVGSTALVEGIGDIITPISPIVDCHIVIAKPALGVNTGIAFKKFDSLTNVTHPNCDNIIGSIAHGDIIAMCESMGNVLEDVCDVEDVHAIKQSMIKMGALGSMMTGSGSAVFGIFTDYDLAQKCRHELEQNYFTTICKPVKEMWQ